MRYFSTRNFIQDFEMKYPSCRKARNWLGLFGVLCILAVPLGAQQAEIRGRVVEKSSNRSVPGQRVDLVSIHEGMRTVHTFVTDGEGRFSIAEGETLADGVYLLNLFYKRVRYDVPLTLSSGRAEETVIEVYDTTESPDAVRVRQVQILLQARGQKIQVQEAYEMENRGNRVFSAPTGTFSIRLDPATSLVPTITATGVMNLPIPQDPEPTGEAGEFRIFYPLKPGITVVHVSYEGDYASAHYALRDRVPFEIDRVEARIFPSDLRVTSPILTSAGPDASTGMARWVATGLKPDSPLELHLEGEAGPVSEMSAGSGESGDGGGGVIDVPNAVDQRKVTLLVLMSLLLIGSAAFSLLRAGRDVSRK